MRQWSEVTRPSADCQTTFSGRFKRFGKILKKVAERSHDNGWGHATVGRLSNNVFWTFQTICKVLEKSRWTVTRQWLRSRDRRPTVKQRFLDVSSNKKTFWKKSLNGHATVVGGHATVGRLSNNVFWTFQAIWENFEKSRWTVTRQWLRSRDRRPTVKRRFWTFQAISKIFEKSRWTVTRQWSEVTRPSADCQTTFSGRFKRFGKILKKVAERSRDNGWGHATVGRLSNNVFWTFQAIRIFFEKSRWTVTRQWSEVTRPSADCQTTFFGRFKRFGKILKKVAERSRDSGWGHATVGRLSNNVFWRFKQLENILKKVAERSRDSGRRSRDRRPTVKQRFWRFQEILKNFEKSRWTVTRQWLRSRDRRPTVKQRFLDVSSN